MVPQTLQLLSLRPTPPWPILALLENMPILLRQKACHHLLIVTCFSTCQRLKPVLDLQWLSAFSLDTLSRLQTLFSFIVTSSSNVNKEIAGGTPTTSSSLFEDFTHAAFHLPVSFGNEVQLPLASGLRRRPIRSRITKQPRSSCTSQRKVWPLSTYQGKKVGMTTEVTIHSHLCHRHVKSCFHKQTQLTFITSTSGFHFGYFKVMSS